MTRSNSNIIMTVHCYGGTYCGRPLPFYRRISLGKIRYRLKEQNMTDYLFIHNSRFHWEFHFIQGFKFQLLVFFNSYVLNY